MFHDQETICKIEQHCVHDKDTQVTRIEKTRHQRHRAVRIVKGEGVRKEEKSEVLCSRLMMTQYFDKRTVCMTCRVLKFTVSVFECWLVLEFTSQLKTLRTLEVYHLGGES